MPIPLDLPPGPEGTWVPSGDPCARLPWPWPFFLRARGLGPPSRSLGALDTLGLTALDLTWPQLWAPCPHVVIGSWQPWRGSLSTLWGDRWANVLRGALSSLEKALRTYSFSNRKEHLRRMRQLVALSGCRERHSRGRMECSLEPVPRELCF